MQPRNEEKRAVRTWHEARVWISSNPDAWGFIQMLAEHEAASQRRFSMQWLVEQARKKEFAKTDGSAFNGVNNTLRPTLARILAKERPEVEPWMTKRRSASVDALGR